MERRIVEWLAAFGLSGLVTVVLALGLAIVLAARISRPFAQLALDAERLGSGDLETPVPSPVTFLAEPVALAASLEQMRRRVGTLTATERNQREELDAVLDGVDEGIVGVDADQLIHYANRQFLALVGRSREDVIGQPADEILLPDESQDNHPIASLPVGQPQLERCTAAETMRQLIVRRLAASDGRQILVVREENAIEAARAMRDRILANLSHEFQTPLSAQIASIELLARPLAQQLRCGRDQAWPTPSTGARCGCRNWSTICWTACASKAARCACAGSRWIWRRWWPTPSN